jgi:hypothetical protein
MGSEFRISTGYGNASDVAFDGTNFFVVWSEDMNDNEIRGRFVSTGGVPGTEISVNASPAPSDNPKSVSFDGINYLVVWNDESGGANTGNWDVFGQLVSPGGTLVGSRITISTEAGPQMATTTSFDGANYLVAWVDMQSEMNWDLYGQFIGRSGTLIGSKVPLSTEAGNQLGGAMFANGKYLAMVNNGVIMGEDGITQVDSATGLFLSPLPAPQIQIAGASFGVGPNGFGFNITGLSGQMVVVEATTSVAAPAWSPLQTNTLTGSSWYFRDPQWTNSPARLYRLRSR